MATARGDAALQLRDTVLRPLNGKITLAGSDSWSADSADAFLTSARSALSDVLAIAQQYEHDATVLSAYAWQVESIARDAAALRARELETQQELTTLERREGVLDDSSASTTELDRIQGNISDARREMRGFEGEWDALVERRTGADSVAFGALSGAASRGGYAALAGQSPSSMTDASLMALLTGMSGSEILALLRSDPALADRIAKVGDPAAVAAWWQGLGDPDDPLIPSDVQLALLTTYPGTFGNLDGIWYTHRDIANRTAFETEWQSVSEIAEGYFPLVRVPNGSWDDAMAEAREFLAQHGYTVAEFMAKYSELKAIDDTLDGERDAPYQFIQYHPGDPTLAAIAVGNMDTASQITTAVPGMGSSVTGSMQEWTLSAENVYSEQERINLLYGNESGLAVVAWIGYDAPEMPPSLEVLSSDHAQAGADNLTRFLEGITATRGWEPGQDLSVIGHSYGTTTASLALTETPVEHFVMLGSAGLDNSITDVSDLQVDADNVWASEADADHVADLGRGELDEWWFQGPILEPWMGESYVFEHQVNPTSSGFGANVFSSESAEVSGQHLEGSDGHSTSPQVTALLDDESTEDYGYLDAGTNPLHNAALLSLGHAEQATVPIPPSGGGGGGGGGW